MEAFIYQAALHCGPCGAGIRAKLAPPSDISDESTYDSDAYPKGPYADGGGEADSPQHCDACGVFLENPLTADGLAYVRHAIGEAMQATGNLIPLETWAPFYSEDLRGYFDSEFGRDLRASYAAESLALLQPVSEFVRSWLCVAMESGVSYPEWHPDSDRDNAREFYPDDIHPESLAPMIEAASELESLLDSTLLEALEDDGFTIPGSRGESIWEAAGSFARLEAEGHGVGFWDGRWGDYGDALSEIVQTWRGVGSLDGLYFGDDGAIYGN